VHSTLRLIAGLMYIGLTLTYPSVFQMLRGSVIIFTGILSVLFLKRKLWAFEWLGMGLVTIGLAIVGYVMTCLTVPHSSHALLHVVPTRLRLLCGVQAGLRA